MTAVTFLKECGTFMLLTADGDKPAGRPFGAVTDIDGQLCVSTGAGKAVYGQMKTNPNVQIVALKSGTRDWIRIDGRAAESGDLSKKARMLDDCPNLRKHHSSAEDPSFHLFCITVEKAVLYTQGGAVDLA